LGGIRSSEISMDSMQLSQSFSCLESSFLDFRVVSVLLEARSAHDP
jgi:hypothetical protein